MMNLGRWHRWVGTLTILAFLATGILLKFRPPDIFESHEVAHHLFRTNHVYILLSGLLNLAIGLDWAARRRPRARALQLVGSILLVAGPLLLVIAFIVEPARPSVHRPITAAGVMTLFLGTMSHVVAKAADKKRPQGSFPV
jgi:hypothetical protein